MLYILLCTTAIYALSLIYGTALDAVLVVASLAVVLAWAPRIYYGFVFHKPGSMVGRVFGQRQGETPFADDALATIANRLWIASIAVIVALTVVLCMGPELAGQPATVTGTWGDLMLQEKRFVLMWVGGLGSVITGMVDSISQWNSGKFEYQMRREFEKLYD